MDRNNPYFKQAELLVRVLPNIARETCFALKGGTAINLFVRNLSRLSVDIDLVYLPIEDRKTSLTGIDCALNRIADSLEC
jgi:predicted nucleotidyltransferase component of viral defense system